MTIAPFPEESTLVEKLLAPIPEVRLALDPAFEVGLKNRLGEWHNHIVE